jgi:VanZ family protein
MDKVIHGGIFLVFSVLWLEALPTWKNRFAWVAVAGLVLAALTELGQNIPAIKRDGEVVDAVADMVGVALGLPLFHWLNSLRTSRQYASLRDRRNNER